MFKTVVTISLLAFIFSLSALSQFDLTGPVPLDPEVRTGVLENGMTYYIRSNQEPKERASFYIIQNVGAILENDNQNGLAHFLEHMAFNGTQHFPGKGIIETLERHGVAFGRNINAYTAQDETVYNISDVPVGPEGLIDTCLLVLHDWSNYLLLEEAEIDAERGVISEEWRTRRNSGFRLSSQFMPVLANYSKYAYRDVIGDLEIIQNFNYDVLRQFYHNWYRTDLQAIAVVGDFDVDVVEAKVKTLFSAIPPVENAQERLDVSIPENEVPMYVLASDKEATNSKISLYIRHEAVSKADKNHAYLRIGYMKQLASMMINARISELLQTGMPPFINGSIGFGNFTRKNTLFYVSATAKDNEESTGFEAILKEAERIKRFGFTEGELERAKINLLKGFENAFKQKDKIRNDSYCHELKALYIDGVPAPGIDYEYEFAKSVIPGIHVSEVSDLFSAQYTDENRVVIITGPEKEGIVHLTEKEAFDIIAEVEATENIQAYIDELVSSNLITNELPVGAVIATKALPELGAVEWTLSNQAKVVYRFADYNKERVSFNAFSKGGSSLYGVEDLPSAQMTSGMMGAFGVGDFDATALKKALTGKSVSMSPSISTLSEGLSGSCQKVDFESMMQLAYLYFEKPRFDQAAFDALMARNMAYISNKGDDPARIMSDSISQIMSNYHPRSLLFNEDFLKKVSFERLKEIYQERFSNASDFVFFIVGDIGEEQARELSAQYLGAISSQSETENWIDHHVDGPEGELNKVIPLKMATPKSTVRIELDNDLEYIPDNQISLSMIKSILTLRYTESVREKEGGTYGVGVRNGSSQFPKAEGTITISFDCDPDRSHELIPLIYKEIDLIVANGPTQEDLDKVKMNLLKSRTEQKENNGYWMNVVYNFYVHGINGDLPVNYEDIVNNMSVDALKIFARDFFNSADKVELVFEPKEE